MMIVTVLILMAVGSVTLVPAIGRLPQQARTSVQRPDGIVEVHLRVRGIGLGSSYSLVRQRLGRPRRLHDERQLDDTCGPPHTARTLDYDGLTVVLLGTLNKRNFTVVSMDVTSRRWLISQSVRVGMRYDVVKSVLGKDYEGRDGPIAQKLNYVNSGNDGFARLTFERGLLVRVAWGSALC
jgi:hypothetical protein